MNDQYYTRCPQSESRPAPCAFNYRGCMLTFQTDAGVFSRGELDEGSRLLLEALPALFHRLVTAFAYLYAKILNNSNC